MRGMTPIGTELPFASCLLCSAAKAGWVRRVTPAAK